MTPRELRRLLLTRAGLASAALASGSLAGGAALAGTAFAGGSGAAPATAIESDESFWFGFIGDTPYSRLEEGAARRVLDAMSQEPLQFVLHVGDIKSSVERCDDGLLSSRLEMLGQCAHPLILTPGDNEWTDCNRSLAPWAAGGRLERLDWLRRQVYGQAQSLGLRRMALTQQGPYAPRPPEHNGETGALPPQTPRLPENLRWRVGSLQFCTLHVVGSNNAPRRTPELAQAWSMRQEANGAWLNETVELAIRQGAKGLAIAMHANMRFDDNRSDGWERMRQLVVAAAVAFNGPVLLLHGDTHHFRTDQLLLRSHGLANLRRVECFGSPFSSSWVQVRWNPALAFAGTGNDSNPFHVSIRSLP